MFTPRRVESPLIFLLWQMMGGQWKGRTRRFFVVRSRFNFDFKTFFLFKPCLRDSHQGDQRVWIKSRPMSLKSSLKWQKKFSLEKWKIIIPFQKLSYNLGQRNVAKGFKNCRNSNKSHNLVTLPTSLESISIVSVVLSNEASNDIIIVVNDVRLFCIKIFFSPVMTHS